MAIHVDVLAGLDERAADTVADALERRMAEAGASSGTAFGRHFGEAMATIVGATGAAAIGLGKIGEQFEDLNRDIALTTTASGAALDEMRAKVDALAGTLDTSMSGFGNVMGVLAGRLQAPIDQVSTLGVHVQELSGRFKGLDVGNLSAAFVQFGVGAGQADNVLASLLQTSQQYQVALPALTNNLSQFAVTLTSAGLNMQQSGHLMGEMQRAAIPLQSGLMGLEAAAKTWNTAIGGAASGRTYQQFLLDAANAMRQLSDAGKTVEADQMAVTIGGQRRWQQFAQAVQIYLDTVRAGGTAFEAYPGYIDKVLKATETLHNQWERLRNQVSLTLEPVAAPFIDVLIGKLRSFGDWAQTHQDDLRNMFSTAADVAGTVITGLERMVEFLGQNRTLVEAVVVAFAAWEGIRGISAVITGLETVANLLNTIMRIAPAAGAAAGAGQAAGQMALPGMEGIGAGAAAGGVTAAGVGAVALPWMLAMGGLLYAGDQVRRGQVADVNNPGAGVPGVGTTPAQVHGGIGGVGGDLGDLLGAPRGTVMGPQRVRPGQFQPGWGAPAPAAPPGAAGPGQSPIVGMNPDGTPLTLDDLQNPKKPGKGTGPQVPYPADYGRDLAPGETPEHYRNEMALIDARHDVAQKRAELNALETAQTRDENAIVKARNDLRQSEVRQTEAAQRGASSRQQGAQVPFGPGYGAAPRPGESAQVYSAEQGQLEAQHRTATARAQLTQVERDSTATAEDLVKARNDVLTAEREEYQSQLRLNEALTRGNKGLDDFGMKLDSDFGLSKGLPGLAENLVKFLGNLAFAPAFGALAGTEAAAGGVPKGAGGLIGMAAVSGAFGPQFTGAGSGSGTGPGGSAARYGSPYGAPGASPGAYGTTVGPQITAGPGGAIPASFASAITPQGGQAYAEQLGPYNGPDQQGQFPQWVRDLGARFNLTPSTYGGHQTSNRAEAGFSPNPGGANRGIDWNGTPQDRERFAQFAAANPELFEQAIYSGQAGQYGVAGGHRVGPGTDAPGYYAGDFGGHTDHVHTRFGQGFDLFTAAGQTGFQQGGGRAPGANWDAIAARESGGNWAIPSDNSGAPYRGGLQILDSTWRQFGGTRYAPTANLASKDQQIEIAEQILAGQGPGAWPNTFVGASAPAMMATGGPVVPINAHAGEWVIRKDAVDHYGPGFMASINARSFNEGGQIGPFPVPPQVAAAAQPAPGYAQIGTGMAPVTVTPTGGIQPPEAPRPNAPAPPMVGTNPDTSVTAPGTPHAGTGAAPGAAGPTQISGVSPPQGYGQGIHSTGGGIIGAAAEAGNIMPGAGAAAQIASQEAQRLIQYGGQVAGALTQGFLDTVLPTGGSKLAQNNWITRIAGGIVGARPQIPQLAGIDSQTGQPRPTPTAEGLLGPTTPHQGAGTQPGAGTTHHGPIIQINGDLNAPNADRAGNDINRHLQQTYAGNTGAGR